MRPAAELLKEFKVPFEVNIVSAHRTPLRMVEYACTAHERGLRVIIAGAGGAAHLPGMVASMTPLPVVGVPVRIEPLNGEDALLSIVQMPAGGTLCLDIQTDHQLLRLTFFVLQFRLRPWASIIPRMQRCWRCEFLAH